MILVLPIKGKDYSQDFFDTYLYYTKLMRTYIELRVIQNLPKTIKDKKGNLF